MNALQTCTRRCDGDVKPCRFVKANSTYSILQATDGVASAGDFILGITDRRTWLPPIWDDGLAGTTKSPPVTVFMNDAEVLIVAGGTFAVGSELKSDSDGRAIAVTTANDNIGALALEPALVVNQLVKVRVTTCEVYQEVIAGALYDDSGNLLYDDSGNILIGV